VDVPAQASYVESTGDRESVDGRASSAHDEQM